MFVPPNSTRETLLARPFHVYHPDFLSIIGSNPALVQVAQTSGDPRFHEAVIWNPPTDDVFFVQNAGAPAAGTGLNKSAIIQKINLGQVSQVYAASSGSRNISGQVTVSVVNTTQSVVNPNGKSEIMLLYWCVEG